MADSYQCMLRINPARMLGVDDRKGSIQAGKDADLVVLNDDYSVEMTYAKEKKLS